MTHLYKSCNFYDGWVCHMLYGKDVGGTIVIGDLHIFSLGLTTSSS